VDPFDPRGAFKVQFRSRWKAGFLGGLCTGASYGFALWAMTVAPIAIVAGLRETSVIFGTFWPAFSEGAFGPMRYAAAFLVTAEDRHQGVLRGDRGHPFSVAEISVNQNVGVA